MGLKASLCQILTGTTAKVSLFDSELGFVVTLDHHHTTGRFVHNAKQSDRFVRGKVRWRCLCLCTVWYGNTLASASVSSLWLKRSMTFSLCRTLQWQQMRGCVRCCTFSRASEARRRGQRYRPLRCCLGTADESSGKRFCGKDELAWGSVGVKTEKLLQVKVTQNCGCSSCSLDLSETAITVFSVLGLFSSQATASLCILFTAEIMPTIIR